MSAPPNTRARTHEAREWCKCRLFAGLISADLGHERPQLLLLQLLLALLQVDGLSHQRSHALALLGLLHFLCWTDAARGPPTALHTKKYSTGTRCTTTKDQSYIIIDKCTRPKADSECAGSCLSSRCNTHHDNVESGPIWIKKIIIHTPYAQSTVSVLEVRELSEKK